jgi:glycine/D-amino acid oxidase-like deaminating enzyme
LKLWTATGFPFEIVDTDGTVVPTPTSMLMLLHNTRQRCAHHLQLHARTLSTTTTPLPDSAEVVVVGGGIIGTSIAYHLAKHGCKEVVLLERDQLTSGTTWHAAGLMVTFGSLSETSTSLRKYSKELYSNVLEAETGQATGFKPCGFIELATHPDRVEEFRRVSAFNRACGIDVEEISPQQVQDLFPLCNVDDVLAGYYVKDDGRVNPYDATQALAKGAKQHGVKIYENTTVTGVTKTNDRRRVTGVVVKDANGEPHTIESRVVVNAAGMWARQLGELAGVCVPNQAAEHYYLVTDPIEEVNKDWPIVEDPSSYTYIRPEAGGLMVGLFETEAAAWNVQHIPQEFSFGEITPDWDRMGGYLEKAMNRVPVSLNAGAKTFFCGPESFTPDLNPILGEAPELENYFVAAGMNSIGILTGGGIGNLM